MDEALCLMTVHAHPDDEASKGAGTVARYHQEGVRTVLVCCTGGESGDILNPAMDRADVRERIADIRLEELARSAEIIGYDDVVLLGYRDSGMPGTSDNEDPRSFVQAPLDEAVGRLVAEIRRARPQVVITYGNDNRGYPHPDHIRVHEISVAAFDAAGDPTAFPGEEPPWQPLKLYYTVWSRARIIATHEKFLELGLESPFPKEWTDGTRPAQHITTSIDVSEQADVRPQALLAHATQVDPKSPFWFGLPPEVARTIHPYDDYVLARSLVQDGGPGEDDLFAGVRERVSR
jgi:mycothiol S-conjugate amidase